jgi:DNA-binding response OmpR family regulator
MIFRRKKLPANVSPSPVVPPARENMNPAEAAAPAKKILLVDDDPVIRGALTMKLQSKGYQVVTASDGSEALSLTREERPDLMLMDVQFPPAMGGVAWNGFALTEWIRRMDSAKNMPVIVISGTDRPEYRQRASSVGAAAFLPKPLDSTELLTSIDTALYRRAGDPSVAPGETSRPETYKMEPVIRGETPAAGSQSRSDAQDALSLGGL